MRSVCRQTVKIVPFNVKIHGGRAAIMRIPGAKKVVMFHIVLCRLDNHIGLYFLKCPFLSPVLRVNNNVCM